MALRRTEAICSECGTKFVYFNKEYSYKTSRGKQCSYSCHEHAVLRLEKCKVYVTRDKYIESVKRNEANLIGQGKTVLSPIDLSDVK